MKVVINLVFWLFLGIASAGIDQYQPNSIRECDEIYWLTPTLKNEREYMFFPLPKNNDYKEIIDCFSEMRIGENVQSSMMEPQGSAHGYLVFKKSGKVMSILQIEHRSSDRKAVRYCEWVLKEDNLIVIIRYGGFVRSLITTQEWRTLIENIKRPAPPPKEQLFKLYVGYK